MSKVNDAKGGLLKPKSNDDGEKPPTNQIELTPENAAIFSAKFLEMIALELKKLNANLEKIHG